MRVHSVLALALLPLAARAGQTVTQIAPAGTAQISGGGSATDLPGNEVRSNEIDKRRPDTGTGLARVPADHVPAPAPNAIALVNPGFSGFLGLTHRDQRNAGTGIYANTQFSLEPPDQMLCVGNGFVLEGVNTALAVYRTDGTRIAGPTAFNQFLGLRPEVVRSNPPAFGDFTSDPKCYFDPDLQRFFITILQLDVDVQGRPQNVKVISSPQPGFDESALAAAQKLRFEPARRGATPIAVRSKNDRRLSALSTPIAVPESSQRTDAPLAIETVTGRSLVISCHTGTLLTKE